MRIIRTIGMIFLFYLGCIIVLDIAGVICATLLPEPGGRRLGGQAGFGSIMLYYVVWLVAGLFAGSFFGSLSIGVTKKDPLVRQFPFLILLIALVLSAAFILVFYSIGEMQMPVFNTFHDYYVPGHAGMTYTFFIAFIVSCVIQLIVSQREE